MSKTNYEVSLSPSETDSELHLITHHPNPTLPDDYSHDTEGEKTALH